MNWVVERRDDIDGSITEEVWKVDGSERIAVVDGLPHARLIAAAPELLNGCNALLGLLQIIGSRDDLPAAIRDVLMTNHRVQEAVDAIAKTEGRS